MLDLDDLYLLNCNPNIFLFKAGFKLLFIFAEKISMSRRIISIHMYTNQAVIVYYTLIHPSSANYNCICTCSPKLGNKFLAGLKKFFLFY